MNRTYIIKIEENSYPVSFPTVGQIMEIESMKFALTQNRYQEMSMSGLKKTLYALDLVDTIATFFTLIPTLSKSLSVESIFDIDPFKAKELIKAYKKFNTEFFKPLMDELMKEEDESEK